MRISKAFKILSLCLVLVFMLSACSSSEEKNKGDNSSGKNDTDNVSNTNSGSNDSSKDSNSNSNPNSSSKPDNTDPDEGKKFGEADLDLGDLDSETLKICPKESIPSMYYYGAKVLDDTVFYPDQKELLGDPYMFNGTVLEEYDDIKYYLDMNKFGENLSGLDVSSKGYKVMTKTGSVIVVNTVPHMIKYIRDTWDPSVLQLDSKCWFSELKNYKDMPETGDTCKFYGFYLGYSEKDECPVFTYGVSYLARGGLFENNYLKYRRDEVKTAVYPSRISFEYPVGWSDYNYLQDSLIIYLPGDDGYLSIYSIPNEEMSIDDVVKMLTGELSFQMPEDMPEDMPDGEGDQFQMPDLSERIKINTKEKVLIGDGSIDEAYHLEISQKANSVEWQDETAYVFRAKHYIVIMEFGIYNKNASVESEGSSDTAGDAGSDIPSDTEDEENSDVDTDVNALQEELIEVYHKEFEQLLKTIRYNGY